MATNRIKGLTVEIGGDTTKLGDALKSVNGKSRDLSSELGEINRLLKLDPSNTELLSQKQKVLAEAIENSSKKLGTLKEAEKQVQEQFERGEVSQEQLRDLQREIVATENKIKSYEKAVSETTETAQKLDGASSDTAKRLNKESDAAQKAGDSTEDMGKSMADAAKTGVQALAAAAAAAVGAVAALAESTREYRTALGKLYTAFKTAGFSSQAAYDTYTELQGVLGETDQAVEAANHLSMLTRNQEDLSAWTEICTGVFARFGDSLPIEGLTEAANETSRTGELTGALSDALNWAGVHEDDFRASLDRCATQQERQALITETLTRLYRDAADEYRETNAEVIRANKATEKWNATMARMGKKIEPVMTDVKELGTSLLEYAEEPMEVVAGFISQKLIPTLKATASWTRSNFPVIKTGMAGITAAVVAFRAATLASELATKGWTTVTIAQTIAQKALNLAMSANPVGLFAAAIVGLTTAIVAFGGATYDAVEPIQVLTEEEEKLVQGASDAADAFRDQEAATAEAMGSAQSQMAHITDLTDELLRLADSSGNVEEADRARAEVILGQLNDALGTEYEMTDGVIGKYDELKDSIYDVIDAKTANAMLEAKNEDYLTAITKEDEALAALSAAERDYQGHLAETERLKDEITQLELERQQKQSENDMAFTVAMAQEYDTRIEILKQGLESEEKTLREKKKAYDEAAADYGGYHQAIQEYEHASLLIQQGNYDQAIGLLNGQGEHYRKYADTVDAATADVLDSLYKEAVDAGLAAKETKDNFERGVAGYTQEMVAEAERGYKSACDAYKNAYKDANNIGARYSSGLADGMEAIDAQIVATIDDQVSMIYRETEGMYDQAHQVGKDFGAGLMAGIRSMSSSVANTVIDVANATLVAARRAFDEHSPSKKMITIGKYAGEGLRLGLEAKTESVVDTAQDQVKRLLSAYSAMENDSVPTPPSLQRIAVALPVSQSAGLVPAGTTFGDVTIQINGADKDPAEIARAVSDVINRLSWRRVAASGT